MKVLVNNQLHKTWVLHEGPLPKEKLKAICVYILVSLSLYWIMSRWRPSCSELRLPWWARQSTGRRAHSQIITAMQKMAHAVMQVITVMRRRNKAPLGMRCKHLWLPKGVNPWTTSAKISQCYSEEETENEQGEVSSGQLIEELKNPTREFRFFWRSPRREHDSVCSEQGLSYSSYKYRPRVFFSK